MSGIQVSTNAVSTIPETAINDRTVLQPNTLYTCPANKKAKVKGRVVCTGLGAAAEARFSVAGIIMFRWIVNNVNGLGIIPDSTSQIVNTAGNAFDPPINTYRTFDVNLEAGETIVTSQDSGTNSEFNTWMKVQESPT